MGRTIAMVSESTIKIQAFLEKQKPGVEVSYKRIEHESGVRMDARGKQYLRSALRRAKIESSTIIGEGIVLADPDNAMGIVAHKLKRIDGAVRRGERSHKNIQEQFFESMSPEEQRKILFVGAVFGAIRVASENGRVVYKKDVGGMSKLNIPLPRLS